jgi:hypothetical protein
MPEPDAPDPTTDDLIALMRAEGDQMQAAAAQLASVLIAFRKPLVDGGVAPEAADGLTCSYWGLLVARGLQHA